MTFAKLPDFSKSDINRAGKALAASRPGTVTYKKALQVVNAWRTAHAYPMNTFNATLRLKVKKYSHPIVAQRLKRLPTIKDKLKRYPDMQLARMQDIGGVRAVLASLSDVHDLQKQYHRARFTHELVREDDYIAQPKEDGYRGVHLVYRYNNTLARNSLAAQYKGLAVELQLRTSLQHTWATAVETMGMLRGESYKTDRGSEEWLEFFALVSSAFAHVESTPLVSQFAHLDALETSQEIKKREAHLDVLAQIRGLSVAANAIHTRGVGGYYNLISLNRRDKTVRVYTFTRDMLQQATAKYAELEATVGPDIDLVLVSVNELNSLKAAYPNYFLDVRDFVEKVEEIIAAV